MCSLEGNENEAHGRDGVVTTNSAFLQPLKPCNILFCEQMPGLEQHLLHCTQRVGYWLLLVCQVLVVLLIVNRHVRWSKAKQSIVPCALLTYFRKLNVSHSRELRCLNSNSFTTI